MQEAYEEIVEFIFIARGTMPTNIIAFWPSEMTQARIGNLIRRQKDGSLNEDESTNSNI